MICDVAVAAAYQLSTGDDPFDSAIEFVQAYNSITTLECEEIELLPDLMMARLVASLVIATWRARRFPENRDYIIGDAKIMAARLKALSQIPTHEITRRFREACGIHDRPDFAANQQSDEELKA